MLFGGDDFYNFAVFELVTERDELAVDASARGVIADLSMDRVGKVYRCGSAGEIFDVSLGGEDEDTVFKEIMGQAAHENRVIFGFALPSGELTDPFGLSLGELKAFFNF